MEENMIEAKVIEDSISEAGKRITTLQLIYPRFIHSEFMTHRLFSRNASSSRAIPVTKMIEMVRNNPAMPIHWGKNQPGMQANEQLARSDLNVAKQLWLESAQNAANIAEKMFEVGLHKQVANRILEPYQHIHVVVTSTEWDNWFELRAHEDAQPEIHELALQMKAVIDNSKPILLKAAQWHLPYVTIDEKLGIEDNRLLCNISAARCCRVSYLKHDGSAASIEEDLKLCDRLIGAKPLHASPFEHQAIPAYYADAPSGNFYGWIQNRKLIEKEIWSK